VGEVTSAPPIPFGKVLVANRGEIAVRILRTLRALGIRSVAVYSEADAKALHVSEADEAVLIGASEPRESYLRVDPVVAAARTVRADAIHPGYGFLSERADFARACESAGIVFVGPPAAVLEATGDKLGVKARVAKAGVPVIPGPLGPVGEGADALAAAAKATGFPMLLKAIGGGGGRGLRRVDRASDLGPAAESARREAGGAFGDARLYAEALILPARHVEVQILCDARGEVRVLGDRDCSLQRRHQKVIEEAPAPNLSDVTRRTLHDAAVTAAKALGYRNAGTCEFLVDPKGRPYFLEVNRRIQVEHPVTEAIFGLDLVEWQLRVAAGEALPPAGTWTPHGHAIEARVCAEDPAKGFLPASGTIVRLDEPRGPGLRVDGGFATGKEVPPYYDSMLMKVIAFAETREGAIARLDAALAETAVLGVASNVWFLRRLLADEDVRAARLSTDHLDVHAARFADPGPVPPEALLLAAGIDAVLAGLKARSKGAAGAGSTRPPDPWSSLAGWRAAGTGGVA
jgi:acetyl/propionyl-CoA carboxylase alpha subunit